LTTIPGKSQRRGKEGGGKREGRKIGGDTHRFTSLTNTRFKGLTSALSYTRRSSQSFTGRTIVIVVDRGEGGRERRRMKKRRQRSVQGQRIGIRGENGEKERYMMR